MICAHLNESEGGQPYGCYTRLTVNLQLLRLMLSNEFLSQPTVILSQNNIDNKPDL